MDWSRAERHAARRIYDSAVQAELAELVVAFKAQAAAIERPEQLWELERALREARKDFDDKYDFRFSVLPWIFARLLREGRITEVDLAGLSPDKRDQILRAARD